MSLLRTPIVKTVGCNLLYLSKERPKTILKVFQYQISTSVKRSEKQLESKANFSTFLELCSLNFDLKLCESP